MTTTHRNPVTYFPTATQRQFARNQDLVRGKPYEQYFNGDLWLHDDALPALRAPMDPADAIAPDADGLASLLEPGYHSVETGYCKLPDGSAYVASLVPFPGCTGEMFRWWFWWHAVEPARYTLWYPYNHIAANPVDRTVLTAPGLTDEERYIGTTHHVDEYIGPALVKIAISFVDPADLGFDTDRFHDAGIIAHACARVNLRKRPKLQAVTMVHLARETDDGFELRSRYWFGHDPHIEVLGRSVPVGAAMRRLGAKRMAVGRVAYEQLLHDQIEFTHLSTFLADIHGEFG